MTNSFRAGIINDLLCSVLIGFCCYLYVYPIDFLNPLSTQWIAGNGDFHTHYLGWLAFLQEPIFQWPILSADSYGEGIAKGIVYTDSIPIMAMIAKIVGRLFDLPDFQYFGLFVLLSFILQHYFCYAYLFKLTQRQWPSRLLSIFFVIFPPLIYRSQGHTALTAQWIIVLSLLLFESRTRIFPWIVLSTITLGLHFYLYAIVTALFGAYLIERRQFLVRNLFKLFIYLFLYVGLNLIVLILCGYIPFVPSDATFSGYGEFAFNILSPISTEGGFSRIIPSIPLRYGALEGISYPGIFFYGIIISLLLTPKLVKPFSARLICRHKALLFVLLAALLFSVTPIVSIGTYSVNFGRLPWPLFIIGDIFRASGRFSLPLIYFFLLNVSALYIDAISESKLQLHRTSMILLIPVVSAFVYLYDIGAFSAAFSARMTNYINDNPIAHRVSTLDAVFSNVGYDSGSLSSQKKRIRFYPVVEAPDAWDVFAQYASENSWTTNGVYLARYDKSNIKQQNDELSMELESQELRQDSIYVLDQSSELSKRLASTYPPCLSIGNTSHIFRGHCHNSYESKLLLIPSPYPCSSW